MTDFTKIDQYLDEHLYDSLAELSRLCAQPSVAAQNLGLEETAALVARMLAARGFHVEIIPTAGAPIVFGKRKGHKDKTLLFYDHYDVQPPEPLELWESPPFEPTLRDGKMYARGISDNKGHIVSRLYALDAILAYEKELPCNVKFIIEGEEEISSIHLHEFVRNQVSKLAADACIWEFGGVDYRDVPLQYLGMRGICYVELFIETAKTDLHSGLGGSIFPNAAWRLIWALSTLKDRDEHIRIPGFYDSIIPPTKRDRQLMGALPDLAEEYKRQFGLNHLLKDKKTGLELQGLEFRMAEVFEPTCTICGLKAGYQGEGSKTVLPSFASAKVDFRLVEGQTPEQVLQSLRTHLDAEGFADIQVKFLGGDRPARTDPDDPFIKLVVATSAQIYDQPMEITPMVGGSGPSYPFIHYLGVPVATCGIGYPGAAAHAPNENIRLDLYVKGAKHIARILDAFGR